MDFPGGSAGKESTCNVGDLGSIPGWEDPLEKGKPTHSSILAWRILWTVMGLQRVGKVCIPKHFLNVSLNNRCYSVGFLFCFVFKAVVWHSHFLKVGSLRCAS